MKLKKKKGGQTIKLKSSYVKVSTSKKSVATIKVVKKSKKVVSYKVSAKKAGKATITIKVKKGTYKGTYKCKVTVKAAPKPTAKPTAKPTNAPTQAPSQAPSTEPSTEPSVEPSQTPVVGDVANVSAMVTNSVKGYENTVLAGQDATIQVLVTDKDGNPVANDNVVISFEADPASTAVKAYTVDVRRVAETNSKGIATFVAIPDLNKNNAGQSKIENTDNGYLGSYDIKVTEASQNITAKAKLNIATISYNAKDNYSSHWWEERTAQVLNLNGTTAGYNDIEKGKNSNKSQDAGIGYSSSIVNLGGNSSQYAGTQQVSTDGKDHKVAFKSAVYLNIPSKSNEEVKNTVHVQKVDQKSGAYDTYAKKTLMIPFEIKDLNDVSYATLAFNSATVSANTQMKAYVYYDNNGSAALGASPRVLETYGGKGKSFNQKNFGLQVAKADLINDIIDGDGYRHKPSGIYLELLSAGHVDTAKNAGFDVKDLTYVYKAQGKVDAETVLLDSAKVEWKSVTPVFTKEADVTDAEATAIIGSTVAASEYARVTKTIPVFPYVGNAIIKCYDSKDNVRRYYACAIKNDTDANGAKNVNVLDTAGDHYIISEQEATKSVGNVTDKGNGIVEVDSTESGTTYLEGTLSCSDEYVSIDARNEKLYTSVMWNPVRQDPEVTIGRFAAVEGQSVTLTAQLVDKNGNPVSQSGTNITWNGIDNLPSNGVSVIGTPDTSTNAKGQATLKLNGTEAVSLRGISASEKSGSYNVVLQAAGQTVSSANIYWLSMALGFVPYIGYTGTAISTKDTGTATGTAETVTVGESWEYAAKVEAEGVFLNFIRDDSTNYGWTIDDDDVDTNYSVTSVTGVIPNAVQVTGSTGTAAFKDGIATVTSDKAGNGSISATLDSSIKTEGGKAIFENPWGGHFEVPFVGEGKPNVNEDLTINYSFEQTKGFSASFINPTGTTAVTGSPKTVYVKVVDEKGNAVKDKAVTVTGGTAVDVLDNTLTGANIKTNANGIIGIKVASAAANTTSTVTAKAGDAPVISETITWRDSSPLNLAAMTYDKDAKTIKMTFDANVAAESVRADQFSVAYEDAHTSASTYTPASVKVAGRDITLTLPASVPVDPAEATAKITVTIADATSEGIAYRLSSDKSGDVYANKAVATPTDNHPIEMMLTTGTVTINSQSLAALVAAPIISALGTAISGPTLSDFNDAYAEYQKQTDAVKAEVEAGVANLAAAKTAADSIATAKTRLAYNNGNGLIVDTNSATMWTAGTKTVTDLVTFLEAAAYCDKTGTLKVTPTSALSGSGTLADGFYDIGLTADGTAFTDTVKVAVKVTAAGDFETAAATKIQTDLTTAIGTTKTLASFQAAYAAYEEAGTSIQNKVTVANLVTVKAEADKLDDAKTAINAKKTGVYEVAGTGALAALQAALEADAGTGVTVTIKNGSSAAVDADVTTGATLTVELTTTTFTNAETISITMHS